MADAGVLPVDPTRVLGRAQQGKKSSLHPLALNQHFS